MHSVARRRAARSRRPSHPEAAVPGSPWASQSKARPSRRPRRRAQAALPGPGRPAAHRPAAVRGRTVRSRYARRNREAPRPDRQVILSRLRPERVREARGCGARAAAAPNSA